MSNLPSTPRVPNPLSAGKAILIGQLVISLPVLSIMVGSMLLGGVILGSNWLFFALIGFVVAWLWWSLAAPRWRQWALRRGAPPDELQKMAVATGLLWRKGSVFEKTEIRPRDR